ncbi:Integral membrane protein SED5 [Entomophthora muscae]|uniref:Integral membrane protein SED5 n=1 Tax=Entomophthora muscae TaxID=34485 RepID=A0ACC2RRH6_9FUNG|nr:Integral membrane protein SED5 [Entomophthora muscae]
MTIKNRTAEFQAVVRTIRNRQSSTPPNSNGRGPKRNSAANGPNSRKQATTDFSRQAGLIGRKIQHTAEKLQELTKLAKRRTLFDDRPTEINDLTFAIKQEIATINQQLAALQQTTKTQNNLAVSSKQQEQHNANVVATLQSQLATASMSFKDVLEIRSENMKATKERKEQFTYQPPNQSMGFGQPSNFVPDSQPQKEYLALDFGDTALQQMQLVEQQDSYIDTRSAAINSIESTIAELGSVFQQLATMVAEQRDVVQRIDANVEEMEVNISGAQQELLRYFTSISSNRWLILKVFGLVVMFLFLFVALR